MSVVAVAATMLGWIYPNVPGTVAHQRGYSVSNRVSTRMGDEINPITNPSGNRHLDKIVGILFLLMF